MAAKLGHAGLGGTHQRQYALGVVAHSTQEHAALDRVAEARCEGRQGVAIALRHRRAEDAGVGVHETYALLVADDRRGHEGVGAGEQADRARVAVHVLDQDRGAAPQDLGLAQPRAEPARRQAVLARWVDALGHERTSLQREHRRSAEAGALAQRTSRDAEEGLDGGRAAELPESAADAEQGGVGRRRRGRSSRPRLRRGGARSRAAIRRRVGREHSPGRRSDRVRREQRGADQPKPAVTGYGGWRASTSTTSSRTSASPPTTPATQGVRSLGDSVVGRGGLALTGPSVRGSGTLSDRWTRTGDLRSSRALRSLVRAAARRPRVRGPTTPSAARACASWKRCTADAVRGP